MKQNNYISMYYNRKLDIVSVWEKDAETGDTRLREFQAPYYFYVPDNGGEYTSIYKDKLKKLTFKNKWDFKDACSLYNKKFESDISPADKILMDNYYGVPAPQLKVGLLDIEVDYNPEIRIFHYC